MSLKLYFLASDFSNGVTHEDLWWTDGTTTEAVGGAGDSGVAGAASEGLGPEYLTALGQQMIFAGSDSLAGANSNGIWLTDDGSNTAAEVGGVSLGTGHSSNIVGADPSGLDPEDFVAFGSSALFFGLDATSFQGLWSTTGTPAGTVEIGGLQNGKGSTSIANRGVNWDPTNFAAFGSQVIFNAYDSSGTGEYKGLWVTDGSTAGTQEIGGLQNTGIFDSNSTSFEAINGIALGGNLLFSAENAEGGNALWISDGTAQGTTEIGGENNAAIVGANNTGLGNGLANAVRFGDKIFFSGEDASDEQGLWVTDGTVAGTAEVGGIGDASLAAGQKPSSLGLSPTNLVANGQQVFFNGEDALGFRELWVSDGTGSGTHEIGGDAPTGLLPNEGGDGVAPQSIVSLGNGKAVFIGDDDVNGAGTNKPTLWVSDGTSTGTSEIGGLNNQGVSGINATGFDFTSALIGGDGLAYFIGENTAGNSVLWETDGTPGGTKVVPAPAGILPPTGLEPSDPSHWALASPPTVSGEGDSINLNALGGDVTLAATDNVWDTVTGSNGAITLQDAQAFVIGGGILMTLVGVGNAVNLSQTNNNKDAIYGTKGAITLNDAQANVFGGKNNITFASGTTGNVVYLYDTQGSWDNVTGSGGTVHLISAQANVTGGGDIVHFNGGIGDNVSLYSTAGVWDTVYAIGGEIEVNSSQVSVVGGGNVINATTNCAISLYTTAGQWDTVNGSSDQINVNDSQVSVVGGANVIAATAGSTISIYSTGGNYDTISGTGLQIILNASQASIVGGGNVIALVGASTASLYSTAGSFDTINGSNAFVTLNTAQASIVGGGDAIATSGASTASLYATAGHFDTVTGSNAVVILNAAQASIVGGNDAVTAAAGSTASLYNTGGHYDTVSGSGVSIILNAAQASIVGGGDAITAAAGSTASVYSTSGAYDTFNGASSNLILNNAQASVVGGGNSITETAGATASLYSTSTADAVSGSGATLALNGAQAALTGNNDVVYFSGSSALTANGVSESFDFGKALGMATITGFSSTDVIHLSAQDWTSFTALNNSAELSEINGNAVIKLDASDQITLVGVQTSTLTSAQFSFG